MQPPAPPPPPSPPNVVIIFADDLGYGDLGCYGNGKIATPNLDRMAREGMRFTDFYAVSPACSPSRAGLLTGCYPPRVGIPNVLVPQDRIGLHPDELTLAELLKSRGYATTCIGKWHLGHLPPHLPTRHGFDAWFGLPYSNDMSSDPKNNPTAHEDWPPLPLMRGDEVIELEPDQAQLTRRYTEESIRFIEANRHRPFFLYLPHAAPHVPLHPSERFRGRSGGGLYGDVVEELDWSVGQILDTLERNALAENTLVIFTSDNGPWLIKADHGGSAGPLRDGKWTTFEGGMRVPCIMRFPGTIPAGAECTEVAATIDLLPTIAKLAGAQPPRDRIIDGRDILPLMTGAAGVRSPHDGLYFYLLDDLRALRRGKWKLHLPRTTRDGRRIPAQLYDLEHDVGETTNVAADHPRIVDDLTRAAERFRDEMARTRRAPATAPS